MQPTTIVGTLVGAAVVLVWRIRETRSPVTARKLIAPPLGMATGFGMFVLPEMRVPVLWGLAAFAAGVVFLSQPLIRTSELTREGGVVLMRRSKAFLWILLGLVAVRLALRAYVEQYVSTTQTAALFFLLAFGMLLPWRVVMYLRYRRLVAGDGGALAAGPGAAPRDTTTTADRPAASP
jgi:membrane protein CcdC involved in cytochrome C biogenesis